MHFGASDYRKLTSNECHIRVTSIVNDCLLAPFFYLNVFMYAYTHIWFGLRREWLYSCQCPKDLQFFFRRLWSIHFCIFDLWRHVCRHWQPPPTMTRCYNNGLDSEATVLPHREITSGWDGRGEEWGGGWWRGDENEGKKAGATTTKRRRGRGGAEWGGLGYKHSGGDSMISVCRNARAQSST